MLLKVNTSNTDHSGIHAIAFSNMVSMHTVGLTRLDVVFNRGYSDKDSVFSFTINSGKADVVMKCLNNHVSKYVLANTGFICTLYDEYSNYKCCPDITGVSVKTRKV